MKAILMNSAEKIVYPPMQMDKEILKRDAMGQYTLNWLDSDAYTDELIPLDLEMGTGQLNAHRAKIQLAAGEWDPPAQGAQGVPTVGWDFNPAPVGTLVKYPIQNTLIGGSYISITLAWDRVVHLNDTVIQNGKYDIGESFTPDPLQDMDLYLVPNGSPGIWQRTTRSISAFDSVEHIFFPLPAGNAQYEIWVHQPGGRPYGLAWWAVDDIGPQIACPLPTGPMGGGGGSARAPVGLNTGDALHAQPG